MRYEREEFRMRSVRVARALVRIKVWIVIVRVAIVRRVMTGLDVVTNEVVRLAESLKLSRRVRIAMIFVWVETKREL